MWVHRFSFIGLVDGISRKLGEVPDCLLNLLSEFRRNLCFFEHKINAVPIKILF